MEPLSKNPNLGTYNEIALHTMQSYGVRWKLSFILCLIIFVMGLSAWIYQLEYGMEWGGISHPISWGIYITNFVFWVGIAHAGTLISAILFLTRARFRTSINRLAEAMTVIAVTTAAIFPIIHLGRAWYAFWVIPYPNQRDLWVNFKSPLIWDAFAISVYLFVSVTFLILGMIPDFAGIRDESKGLRKKLFGLLSFGFRGTSQQWYQHSRAYLLLAALATPLVISVHTIVSWDFAVASIPGWHSTIFAPYFVVGAIYSGCAMVMIIIIPFRAGSSGLKTVISIDHLGSLAKIMILTSALIALSYLIEFFAAFYNTSPVERSVYWLRAFGDKKLLFWMMVLLNCLLPQLFWINKIRKNTYAIFLISLGICIGMWIERFVIVIGSLSQGFDPFTWDKYQLQWIESWITLGSFAWFFGLVLIFIRFFPSVAISELKESAADHQGK